MSARVWFVAIRTSPFKHAFLSFVSAPAVNLCAYLVVPIHFVRGALGHRSETLESSTEQPFGDFDREVHSTVCPGERRVAGTNLDPSGPIAIHLEPSEPG
jgi:hypothetical protein